MKLIQMLRERVAIMEQAARAEFYEEALAEIMIIKDLVKSIEATIRRLDLIS